jgi:hypothetical protein
VDEWNKDVLENGDNAIEQYVGKSDAGVYKAAVADDAFEAKEAEDVEFEPILGSSDPITPAIETTPTQDGRGRPIRVCKPVSRLVPSFKGKSYGATMAQIGAQMVGMTTMESIRHMEKELELMGVGDGDMAAMGVILTHMSIKQSIKKLGIEPTMKSSKAEMKQIHMCDSFKPKHYHKLTLNQKARMVESFIFLKEKKDGTLKARAVLGGNVQ